MIIHRGEFLVAEAPKSGAFTAFERPYPCGTDRLLRVSSEKFSDTADHFATGLPHVLRALGNGVVLHQHGRRDF